MAYNMTDDLGQIYGYKKSYMEKQANGQETTQEENNARWLYDNMRNSGDETAAQAADEMEGSSLEDAAKVLDRYGISGKQELRPYFKNAAAQYGIDLSDSDFSYDDVTGKVSIKGLDMGKPEYLSTTGRSYYSQDYLDSQMKKLADQEGTKGLEQLRPYLKNAALKYGFALSDSDFSYDDATGTVSVRGLDFGKPQYLSTEGRSYYSQDFLDSQMKKLADAGKADETGMNGLQETRPYLKSAFSRYGVDLSDDDIVYDEVSGNVSVKGINIGKPAYLSSAGRSYYDQGYMDKQVQNIVNTLGLTRGAEQFVSQDQEYLSGAYKQDAEDYKARGLEQEDKWWDEMYEELNRLKYTNKFETDEAKSIWSKFQWQGNQAADNAIAGGAAGNSGNIDSYAAANASRQQLAYQAAGVEAIQNDWQQKTDNINRTLNALGIAKNDLLDRHNEALGNLKDLSDTVFNQDETRKNNEFQRTETKKQNELNNILQISDLTGELPSYMELGTNEFFNNETGALYNPDEDYMKIIEDSVQKYEETGDTRWLDKAEKAQEARNFKITHMPGYEQYINEIMPTSRRKTAAITAQERQDDLERYIAESQENTAKYVSDNGLNASIHKDETDKEISNNLK